MNRSILVTGANGNLGVAVVRYFLEQGDRIIAVGRGFDHLKFAKANPHYEEYLVNLAEENAIGEFMIELEKKNINIDAAFFLVGGFSMGNLKETRFKDIQKMFSLNFATAYEISRTVFQSMVVAKKGRLVFVGAKAAIEPKQGKNMIAYALSKSLLFKLCELMNEEGKGKNVTSSVIVPSIIDTPDNRSAMPDANTNHWVKPEKIAELLDFIASEKSAELREMVYKMYNEA